MNMRIPMNDKEPKDSYQFASKWSERIAGSGHTALPNLLIIHQAELDITASEFITLIGLLLHKWDDKDPYPSANRLATYSGLTHITVRRNLRSLEKKGIIWRNLREGFTSEYSIKSLIEKLDIYPQSNPPP